MKKRPTLTTRELSEQTHFDSMARHYDVNYTYNTPFTQFKILRKLHALFRPFLVSPRKKIKILEIGAGTGEYTQHIAQLFPEAQIYALDISPKILEVAQKKCQRYKNISYVVGSVYELPFEDGTFDVVCGFYILHHLDIQICFREIHRTLKTHGYALFYEPNLLNPLVYAIKNVSFLKKLVGDSPEETAINPYTLASVSQMFSQLSTKTSEFILLPQATPFWVAKLLDSITSVCGDLPVIKMFGGSVALMLKK